MLALETGLVLYHGSYAPVEKIDLDRCLPGKDFGRGFYLTSSLEQAQSFVSLSLKKHRAEDAAFQAAEGFVSSYRVDLREDLSIHSFTEADADWLHFVASNRRGDLFPDLIEAYSAYDVIAGKIANDRTARTLQLYVTGAFGEPGSPEADSIAIATLLPNRLENQYCFRTARSLLCLDFEGSEPYGV